VPAYNTEVRSGYIGSREVRKRLLRELLNANMSYKHSQDDYIYDAVDGCQDQKFGNTVTRNEERTGTVTRSEERSGTQ
jgi:hypothetical protein